MRGKILNLLLCALFVFGAADSLRAQGTAFTYQGQLSNGGSPVTGIYDLTFALYLTNQFGTVMAGPITNSAVAVTNGLFTTTLDFSTGVFTGENFWLQITVRTNGNDAFTALAPRQPLLPAPYAIFANTASNLLGSLATTQLNGTLPSTQISGNYSSAVTFSNSANHFAGTFGGDGSSLSNLNATQLTAGTVADARLTTNVALLNTNQIFTGSNTFSGFNTFTGTNALTGVNTFTNFGNSFRGSFFGNGLVGWLVPTGATVQAVSDTGYLLTNSQLVTVTLPATPNVGDIVRISGAGPGGWQTAQNTNQSIIGNFLSYSNSYWTLVQTSDNWLSIASSADGTKLVAATAGKGLFIFSGGVWSSLSANPTGAAGVASSADGSRLVAVVSGVNGSIYTFTNGATVWTMLTGAITANWQAVASSADGSHLVAVILGGRIYASVNSGLTWSPQTVTGGNNQNWCSVASSANGSNLVAAVIGGSIYTNSGSSWAATSSGSKNWISVAASADGNRLVAAVNGGGIYTSPNSGSTWIQQTNAPNANWNSVASSADGTKLAAVVFGGGIFLSSNAGVTWRQQGGAPLQKWASIASSADGTRLAAVVDDTASGIYISQASAQISSLTGTNGFVSGGQGTAVELQYIGNGQFMPVSSAGTLWAN